MVARFGLPRRLRSHFAVVATSWRPVGAAMPTAVAPRQLTVTLPAGAVPQMSAKVVYEGPIKAPITKGQHIADLVVTSPDLPEQRLPLVADKDVGQAGFFGRAWAGLTSFFG